MDAIRHWTIHQDGRSIRVSLDVTYPSADLLTVRLFLTPTRELPTESMIRAHLDNLSRQHLFSAATAWRKCGGGRHAWAEFHLDVEAVVHCKLRLAGEERCGAGATAGHALLAAMKE